MKQNLTTHEISIMVLARGNHCQHSIWKLLLQCMSKGCWEVARGLRSRGFHLTMVKVLEPLLSNYSVFLLLIPRGPGVTVDGVLGEGSCLLLYVGGLGRPQWRREILCAATKTWCSQMIFLMELEMNPCTLDTLSLTKEAKIYNGEKTTSLTSGAGKTSQPHVKEWN